MSKTMIVRSVVLLGQLVAFSALHAQVYPYCAQYSDGASLDCSFSSLSMCEQSVSGVGGICILNPRGGAPSSANAASNFAAAIEYCAHSEFLKRSCDRRRRAGDARCHHFQQ